MKQSVSTRNKDTISAIDSFADSVKNRKSKQLESKSQEKEDYDLNTEP